MLDKIENKTRINSICIKNYKCIDSLEFDFPEPIFSGDPDVTGFGSENGVGKTSLLECCVLLFSVLQQRFDSRYESIIFDNREIREIFDVSQYLVKFGEEKFSIKGNLTVGNKNGKVEIFSNKDGFPVVDVDGLEKKNNRGSFIDFVKSMCGFSSNPLIGDGFIFIHGYRKTKEGSIDPGFIGGNYDEQKQARRHQLSPFSIFKKSVLKSLLYDSKILNSKDCLEVPEGFMDVLNDLIGRYAGSKIEGVKMDPFGKMDIALQKNGHSFSIDSLSSGQKEAVSMTFMVWYYTISKPSVVLIDEPEIHLSGKWHKIFLTHMMSLVPHNQYIIATHSGRVMNAIPNGQQYVLPKIGRGL